MEDSRELFAWCVATGWETSASTIPLFCCGDCVWKPSGSQNIVGCLNTSRGQKLLPLTED